MLGTDNKSASLAPLGVDLTLEFALDMSHFMYIVHNDDSKFPTFDTLVSFLNMPSENRGILFTIEKSHGV